MAPALPSLIESWWSRIDANNMQFISPALLIRWLVLKDLWVHDSFSFRLHHINSVCSFFEDDLWLLFEAFNSNDDHMKHLTISPWNSDGFHEVSHLEGEHSKLRHFHEKSEDNAVGDASRSMDGSSNSRCSVSISRLLYPGLTWFLSKNVTSTGIFSWFAHWTFEDVDGSNTYTCIQKQKSMIYSGRNEVTAGHVISGDFCSILWDVGSCWGGQRLHH